MRWLFENLANAITSFRFILTVWLIVLALSAGRRHLLTIFILDIICRILDVVDGWVARKYSIQSVFGTFFDPLADKILTCFVVVVLAWRFWPEAKIASGLKFLTEGLVVGIVCLETAVVIGAIFCLRSRVNVEAKKFGKLKMFFESAAVIIWLGALVAEQKLAIELMPQLIYLIDGLLAGAIIYSIKSIEEYSLRKGICR